MSSVNAALVIASQGQRSRLVIDPARLGIVTLSWSDTALTQLRCGVASFGIDSRVDTFLPCGFYKRPLVIDTTGANAPLHWKPRHAC
jgi:hypothetical protein